MIDDTAARVQHRPTDMASLRQAALEMSRHGLYAADIGHVLGLDPNVVRQLLGPCPDCAA